MRYQNVLGQFALGLMDLDDFFSCPPPGVLVRSVIGRTVVKCVSDGVYAVADDFVLPSGRRVVFNDTLGQTITVTSQEEYADVKQKLYNRMLILVVSACETNEDEKKSKPTNPVKHYILLVNGIRLQTDIDTLLDECSNRSRICVNFRLKIDFRDPLKAWTLGQGFNIPRGAKEIIPSWENTSITINYRVDLGCPLWYFWGLNNMTLMIQEYPVDFLDNHVPREQAEVREIFEVFNKTQELAM